MARVYAALVRVQVLSQTMQQQAAAAGSTDYLAQAPEAPV
jgi:hypothetical protein